jgi:hypothetical protein
MTARRFPPPWTVEEANAACFIVKDNNGHALAYVYFEQEPGRRAAQPQEVRFRSSRSRHVDHLTTAFTSLFRPVERFLVNVDSVIRFK